MESEMTAATKAKLQELEERNEAAFVGGGQIASQSTSTAAA